MSHLSSNQFADAAEGTVPPVVVEHLGHCDACRATLADLRSALTDAAVPERVEPSPLFWEHFSQRVRAATDVKAVPRRLWTWRPVVLAAGFAGALVVGVLLRPHTPPAASSAGAPVATANATPSGTADAPSVDDGTVDVVSAVSGDLSFDEARVADLLPSGAGVALAVDHLTESQKRELLRIVREEIGALE